MQAKKEMFIEIYQRHRPTILNYIYYRVGDSELAEDLTSDVFVRMLDKYKTNNQNRRPITPWLYAVARNLIIDHQRRAQRIGWQSLTEEAAAGESSNPLRQTEKQTMEACLMKAMENLTEEQRQVIILKFIERRSNQEIGYELRKAEGAIKSLQYRALAGLRRAMEKEACHSD